MKNGTKNKLVRFKSSLKAALRYEVEKVPQQTMPHSQFVIRVMKAKSRRREREKKSDWNLLLFCLMLNRS